MTADPALTAASGLLDEDKATRPARAGCAAGTMILAPRGLIPVERVDPGTHIITADGIHHAVRIDRHSRVQVYRVTAEDGRWLRASGAHRVRTRDASGRPVWTRVDQLRPGDIVETDNRHASILSVESDGTDDVYAIHEPFTGTCVANGYISGAGEV
jgi:intein/homing endonuclease